MNKNAVTAETDMGLDDEFLRAHLPVQHAQVPAPAHGERKNALAGSATQIQSQTSVGAEQMSPEPLHPISLWSDAARLGAAAISEGMLVIRADMDSEGVYSLDARQNAELRRATLSWLDELRHNSQVSAGLSSGVVRDQIARDFVRNLLSTAQSAPTGLWSTCLPTGVPVIIGTAQALSSIDHDALARRVHRLALVALRDAHLPHDAASLMAYESGEAQELL
jgi:hypothetical protein